MKRARLLAVVGGICLALTVGARGEEPIEPKVKVDRKELLTGPKDPHDHAEQPLKKPAGDGAATTPAKVSPEARAELDQVTEAYRNLKGLELAGSLSMEVVTSDGTERKQGTFVASFAAPNKFRHEMKGDMILGSTGEKTYAFQPEWKSYQQAETPRERGSAKDIPDPVGQLLQQQNPGLMCALVEDAGKYLEEGTKEVSKEAAESIDGTAYTVLAFRGDEQSYRVLVDPKTHLVRRIYQDIKATLKKEREDVDKALLTFDYAKAEAKSQAAAADEARFAWAPPEGVKEALAGGGVGEGQAMKLIGKQAPDFTLMGMDDRKVSLKSERGRVVVLDFWATWCGPCRASLPGLNAMYKELKDKGMSAFAVDLQESKEQIQPVKEKLIPDVPVLLDERSEVSKLYGVSGIPQTVVIGKDGKVKKVFIGSGQEGKIRAAVEAALKE
jgi:peroxiredoxin